MMKLLSNLVSQLKQGVQLRFLTIFVLNSKFIIEILKVLVRLSYIQNFTIINKHFIKIYLKYYQGQGCSRNIIQISKSKARIYWKWKFLKKNILLLKKNNGVFILTTSKGLLTLNDLYFYKIGGECLIYIY